MNVRWSLIVAIACLDMICCKVELKTSKGVIKGNILNSRDGRPYYSYTGIPYAKPPVGELRFKVYFMKY